MSILIKGMEMPKNCYDCFAEAFGYCRALKYNPSEPNFRAISDSMTRREDCPLIEVPKHGRLIDADALRSLYDNNAYDTDSITNEEFDKMTVSVAVIRQNIDDMPTIIEANDSIKEVEWETHNDGIMYWWECSRCHHEAWYDKDYLPNYCPYCGAKMTIIEAEGGNIEIE